MSHKTGQPANDEPEKPMLWSEEEDAKLKRRPVPLPPKAGPPSCETNGVRKACPSEGGAIQDELPFP
jgi:hypothetical protein